MPRILYRRHAQSSSRGYIHGMHAIFLRAVRPGPAGSPDRCSSFCTCAMHLLGVAGVPHSVLAPVFPCKPRHTTRPRLQAEATWTYTNNTAVFYSRLYYKRTSRQRPGTGSHDRHRHSRVLQGVADPCHIYTAVASSATRTRQAPISGGKSVSTLGREQGTQTAASCGRGCLTANVWLFACNTQFLDTAMYRKFTYPCIMGISRHELLSESMAWQYILEWCIHVVFVSEMYIFACIFACIIVTCLCGKTIPTTTECSEGLYEHCVYHHVESDLPLSHQC